jgi:mono/diheme cytochrome c family protein
MRGSVRSIAVVIGIGCLLAILGACGARQPTPPPGLNELQLAGWQAYVDLKCASCHGEDREGKRSGPALIGMAEYWSADQLVSYLRDPGAMVEANPRLAYKAEKYAIGMPKFSGKLPGYSEEAHAERLRALAEYMLVDIQ